MKVFILEDDVNCSEIIEWIGESFDVAYAKNIEDAICYLNGHGKTRKLKRGLRKGGYADVTNAPTIKRMIPYK